MDSETQKNTENINYVQNNPGIQPSISIEPTRSIISYIHIFIYFIVSFLLFLLSYSLLYPVNNVEQDDVIFYPEKIFQSIQSVVYYLGGILSSLLRGNLFFLLVLVVLSFIASVVVFLQDKLKLFKLFLSFFIIPNIFIIYTQIPRFNIKGLLSYEWLIFIGISFPFFFGYIVKQTLKIKSTVIKSVLLIVPLVIFLSIFLIKTSGLNGEYNLSLNPNSTSDCQGMKNDENKIKCFYHYSLKNNDLDACEHINSLSIFSFDTRDCESNIINNLDKLGKFEISDCSNFKELLSKNICYKTNGIKKMDFSICDKADDTTFGIKWSCYYEIGEKIANTDKDASNCVTMNKYWREGRNSCFKSVAMRKENISICDFIDNESPDFSSCKQFFSLNKYIKDCLLWFKEAKNRCLNIEAVNRKDISICDFIDKDSPNLLSCKKLNISN